MLERPEGKKITIHVVLFVITLITTTVAGAEWMTGRSLFYGTDTISWNELLSGLQFSIPFLLILSFHEFGHYFVAQYHKVKVSLPYYIPLWLGFLPFFPSFGTMGALIKINENVNSRKKYFDIGIAGPLAGFVVAIFVLTYGFLNLPGIDYIYKIHPDYEQYGNQYSEYIHTYDHQLKQNWNYYEDLRAADSLSYIEENGHLNDWEYAEFEVQDQYITTSFVFGKTLLFSFLENTLVSDKSKIPDKYEASHYPFLLAGFLALLFTSLNLLPIGQLDGGHILYGLIGPTKFKYVASGFFLLFIYYAGLGVVDPYHLSENYLTEFFYFIFLYFCFYRYSDLRRDRWMYASIVFFSQFITVYFFPTAMGYEGWLLFGFILGRFLGVSHPPVQEDAPLSSGRKALGWVAILVLIVSFSPKPLEVKTNVYDKDSKSETPIFLSTVNPSPYLVRMACPISTPRDVSIAMNSGEEIRVLVSAPSGSKNCDL